MHTIEFQKRGLPHAHMLLWLNPANKLKTSSDIDRLITAELPDPIMYPKLAETVNNYMIHGPCGFANLKSPCMEGTKCTKFYPRPFQTSTTIDDDGYPMYRRRDSGLTVTKKGVTLDCRSVVPYNPKLLMRYSGHVNVDYCNKSNSIKYLFKYVNKGPDRATLQIARDADGEGADKVIDEIKQYYDCRYVSPCEAAWRIFAFDIHQHWPPVQKLTFHLPNEQTILFNNSSNITDVVRRGEDYHTMFLAWFEANRKYPQGRHLTYSEYPSKFVYDKKERQWVPRQRGMSIGRLNYVPHGVGELYYMRVLLTVQRGCMGYDDLRRVKGDVQDDFQKACYELGLLANDKEFIDAIKEAGTWASGTQLRRLFVNLLSMCTMTEPAKVWDNSWKILSDGIIFHRRRELGIHG